MTDQPSIDTSGKKRLSIVRFLAVLTVLAVVLILAAPWIIARTGLRDWLVNAIMGAPNLTASSRRASFGWLSPVAIEDMEINGKQRRFCLQVRSIAADRSLARLLASSGDFGTITVQEPHVRLQLPLGERGTPAPMLLPTFTAAVNGAALTVCGPASDEPVIDVDGIDVTLHVQQAEEGHVLTLDPLEVFHKRKLTPKLCNRLLQLMSPSLGGAAQVEGEFSLSLDKLCIPIGIPEDQLIGRIEVQGEVGLHRVSIEAQSALLRALTKVLANILDDKDAPETIRVVKDAKIRFLARNGRLLHEGLCFGLPDIDPALQVTSRGSVGLDETLDLHLELPHLDKAKRRERDPVQCHITGTLSKPQLVVKNASLVLRMPDSPKELLDVDGIDLKLQVEDSPTGHVLNIDPVEVFKRERIGRQLASSLVHLIEPDIEYSSQLTGEVSLTLDRLRIPLDLPKDQWIDGLVVGGKLALHQLTTQAKGPMRRAIVKVLSDLYGKGAMEVVRVAQDAEIDFQVRDGRLHYEGMRLGFPDIDPELQVTSRGSVGLDETLDVHLELPHLDEAKRRESGPVLCHITGTLSKPKLAVKNAALVLRVPNRPQPLIDVDGIDLSMQVEDSPEGHVLAVNPVEVFKKEKIPPYLASSFVHLIEPDLKYSPQLTGEVSLALERMRIPLPPFEDQWIKRLELRGKLALHQLNTQAKDPLRRALVKLLSDLYGKEAAEVVRVAHDTEINFEVRDGRLHYEGMRLGFPDIDPALQVSSRGSVGLDQTLDLHLELPRLDKAKLRERGPVQCHVTGSVSKPKLSIKGASLVLRLPEQEQPILSVDGIDLSMGVETDKEMPLLVLAPFKVFEKQKLTPALSNELLRLAAPTLGDVADVSGEISLTLDTCRLPIAASKTKLARGVELAGRLQLHEISTTVKTPLLGAMVKVLADLYGKKPRDVVRIVENADIRFEVRQGRLFHDGLRFGLPDISPELSGSVRGSVGLDESLDLVLEVPSVLAKAKVARPDAKSGPIRFKITGTIDAPTVVEIKEDQ